MEEESGKSRFYSVNRPFARWSLFNKGTESLLRRTGSRRILKFEKKNGLNKLEFELLQFIFIYLNLNGIIR